MNQRIIGNHLRVHRRKAGLSQREVATLLGYDHGWQVCRHETSRTAPPLLVALAYEALFGVPVAMLFRGMHASVAQMVNANLAVFERTLIERQASGHDATGTARKLQWIAKRKSLA